KQIQNVVRNAVRPRADRQADNIWVRDRGFKQRSELVHGRVSVRRRLKIRDEPIDVITPFQAPNSRGDLPLHVARRHPRRAPAGAEAVIVAKFAASASYRAIDIRASKTGVDTNLLNAVAESLA